MRTGTKLLLPETLNPIYRETTMSIESNAAMTTVFAKLGTIRKAMVSGMVERDEEIDLVLTGLFAGENVLFVGPPGTAKSMLCDALAGAIHGKTFTNCLNKFTTPEEIFGPVSVNGLTNDEYRRITTGKLPDCDVAFIDEIFKAGPAILNSMLKVLNEKVYENGNTSINCPLKIAVAASNEWPSSDGNELNALFDRFVLRKTVSPVRQLAGRDRLLFADSSELTVTISNPLTLDELSAIRKFTSALPFSDTAKDTIRTIITQIEAEGIIIGDRRMRKAVGVARAAAVLNAVKENRSVQFVEPSDLDVLRHVLWTDPETHPGKVSAVVSKVGDPVRALIMDKMAAIDEIVRSFDPKDMMEGTKSLKKISALMDELTKMGDGRATEAANNVRADFKKLKALMVDAD